MLNSSRFWLAGLILVGFFAFVFLKKPSVKTNETASQQIASDTAQTNSQTYSQQEPPPASEADAPTLAIDQTTGETQGPITLTEANFETEAAKCFNANQVCDLSENTWRLYQVFKTAKNPKAMQLLISFLKSQLKDPRLKDLYREDLKRIIDDFYPVGERELQVANYYADLGEPQKALDEFFEIQQRAAADPNVKPVPNVSIANVLYELNKNEDALIYYQMALSDLEANPPRSNAEERAKFLKGRVHDLQERLGTKPSEEEGD